MVLTEDKVQEMAEAALPLIEWMQENLHPVTIAIVNGSGVELLEGVAMVNHNPPETEES